MHQWRAPETIPAVGEINNGTIAPRVDTARIVNDDIKHSDMDCCNRCWEGASAASTQQTVALIDSSYLVSDEDATQVCFLTHGGKGDKGKGAAAVNAGMDAGA